MTGKKIAYIRVSSIDQNPDRQLEGLKVDKSFIDYSSGKDTNRPKFKLMMEYIREDDIIFVHSMDRMSRNVKDLLKTIDEITYKKATVFFVKENLKFSGDDSSISRLLLVMLGAVAEFELSIIRERQREAIDLAKKAGKYKGGVKKLNSEKIEILKDRLKSSDSKDKIAKELGVSRKTIYTYKNALEKQEKVL